jgi:hypothetical protein
VVKQVVNNKKQGEWVKITIYDGNNDHIISTEIKCPNKSDDVRLLLEAAFAKGLAKPNDLRDLNNPTWW